MKRFFVCSVSVCFFLFAAAVLADVTMRDIWRWGLVRKSDILPVGGSMLYETGGVLRVVEDIAVADSNRFVLAFTNSAPVYGEDSSGSVSTGKYASASKDATVAWDRYLFSRPSGWRLDMGGPAVSLDSGQGISNHLGWAFPALEARRPLYMPVLQGESIGAGSLFNDSLDVRVFGGGTNGLGVYPVIQMRVIVDHACVWFAVASNVTAGASEVVFNGVQDDGASPKKSFGTVTVRFDSDSYCFFSSGRGGKYFWFQMDGKKPAYPFVMSNANNVVATGEYGWRPVSVTNYFYSREHVFENGEFHKDDYTNLVWKSVYSNGWHFLVAFTNTPGGSE